MNQDEFRQVVDDSLVPMLQATLEPGSVPSTSRERLASYTDPTHLRVKPKLDAGYRLVLARSQPFTASEHTLAGQFINELATVVALSAEAYQPDLIRAIPRRVVAKHLGGGPALLEILGRFETWSSETYEGHRIVASLGLDAVPANTGIALSQLWDEPFGPVLTNGFDTLLVVGSDSQTKSLVELSTGNESRTAPYRMCEIACWATDSKIAIVLNQRGEILVFQGESLRFVRRAGNWHHYVHETNIRRLSPPGDRDLREAIYESCLDVSFARSGGCIGVVKDEHRGQVGRLVSGDDLLAGRNSYKTRLLSRVIGDKPFQNLDRRTRVELLSLDGAMLLDRSGGILAAGAIVDVPSGSVGGGGRTAAALRLSTIGLGVKVSQDGTITGYRDSERILQT
jgi:hypothetical protein